MKFFAIDQHISVIADIKRIFKDLGHTVDDICLSGHHWVMKREKDSIPGLDGDSWCGFVDREFWNEFYDRYKDRLDQYDGFICCYPPLFSYLYQRWNKPIIIQIPIRYEYPCQSDAKAWEHFNAYLRDGVDKGKIHLCANNPYDQVYTELFLQRSVRYIPSLCEYTEVHWKPKTHHSLYYCFNQISMLEGNGFYRKYDVLKHAYPWDDLMGWKCIVHFPYNISTMSIMEQYASGVPLLFPTLEYAIELYQQKQVRIFEQNTWAGTFGRPSGSVITPEGGFPGGYDPNDFNNIESLKYWLQYADFYNKESMQGVQYFSSAADLLRLSSRSIEHFKSQAWDQIQAYRKRRERAYDGWSRVLSDISL